VPTPPYEPGEVVELVRDSFDQLRRDIVELVANRQMWKEVTDAINSRAADTPATWRNHYSRMYAVAQMVAIRRLARGRSSEVSFVGILRTLADHPTAITEEFIRCEGKAQGADPGLIERGVEAFRREWAGSTGYLDPCIPRRDVNELMRVARPVMDWVDEVEAHRLPPSETGPPAPLFGDIHAAIDKLIEIFQRYYVLLTGTYVAWGGLVIDPDWVRTFDRPLFDPPRGPLGNPER
jgi:hypothetical protein